MQIIHIMSGMPASGKSTKAREMAEQDSKLVHLSRDEIRAKMREELNTDEYFPVSQAEEWEIWCGSINKEILAGKSVIIDQTTLGEGSLLKLFKGIVIPEDAIIIIHLFLVSLEECQFRNSFREGHEYVPPEVMASMFKGAFKMLSTSIVRRLLATANQPLVGGEVRTYR